MGLPSKVQVTPTPFHNTDSANMGKISSLFKKEA